VTLNIYLVEKRKKYAVNLEAKEKEKKECADNQEAKEKQKSVLAIKI
jgi:hypothetical protein